MSNDARYALPFFMERKPINTLSRVITHENGSLTIDVYKTRQIGALVNYSIVVPGWRYGVIKDPKYNYVGKEKPPYLSNQYPDYMTIVEEDGYIVYRLVIPPNILPEGTSELYVLVDGRKRIYYVTRPSFIIHQRKEHTYTPSDIQEAAIQAIAIPVEKDVTITFQAFDGSDNTVDIALATGEFEILDSKDNVVGTYVFNTGDSENLNEKTVVLSPLQEGRYKIKVLFTWPWPGKLLMTGQLNVVKDIDSLMPEQITVPFLFTE